MFLAHQILDAIKNDDKEALIDFIINIDISLTIESVNQFEKDSFLWNSPPLISICCFYGAIKCFEYLCLCDADIYKPDLKGYLPVHFASAGGKIEICDILDSLGADFSIHSDENIHDCIHLAAKYGRIDLIQRFYLRNFDLNTISNFIDFTPLQLAIYDKHVDVVQYLCEKGCVIDKTSIIIAYNSIKKCYYYINKNKNDSPNKNNLNYEKEQQEFHRCLKMMSIFCDFGFDAKIESNNGLTLLLDSSSLGYSDLAICLISNKCENVNQEEKNGGWTALHFAAENGDLKLTKELIKNGAEINKPSKSKMTATHIAVNRGHNDVVQYLMKHCGVVFI
ncbi:hypothetical protein TRFO_25127 [Tritrichomonas foetus]|uniref:Uncharacterized protein n=1 Tax=Tritrichomonas foetus TaxID=1144522 RepID=A0A1J4K5T5_9EUKA|nr:hypothetical protein TRFO_25127 [Tritrichomonas foetus]|eukprot:OHT06817.1 hypothetical protein TRFO_25127 [Tritrichomonas foetus]